MALKRHVAINHHQMCELRFPHEDIGKVVPCNRHIAAGNRHKICVPASVLDRQNDLDQSVCAARFDDSACSWCGNQNVCHFCALRDSPSLAKVNFYKTRSPSWSEPR